MTENPEHETVNRESHPSAGGPEGLAGDLGVSSERTGPFDGIEGTGNQASADGVTDGESPTTRTGDAEVERADEPKDEVRPDPVANKHEFDPAKNPRH